jgi:hypothetical protein
MGVRHDSVVAIEKKTGTRGSTKQVGEEENPAVKNGRARWLLTLTKTG